MAGNGASLPRLGVGLSFYACALQYSCRVKWFRSQDTVQYSLILGTRAIFTIEMSSFKKRAKSLKRTHRERGQVQTCLALARRVVCEGS